MRFLFSLFINLWNQHVITRILIRDLDNRCIFFPCVAAAVSLVVFMKVVNRERNLGVTVHGNLLSRLFVVTKPFLGFNLQDETISSSIVFSFTCIRSSVKGKKRKKEDS